MVRIDKAVRLSPLVLLVSGLHTGEIRSFAPKGITDGILNVTVVSESPGSEKLQPIKRQVVLRESMREKAFSHVRFVGNHIGATVPVVWF